MQTTVLQRIERTTEQATTATASYLVDAERTDGTLTSFTARATRTADAGTAPDGTPLTTTEDLGTIDWRDGRISTSALPLSETTAAIISDILALAQYLSGEEAEAEA